MGRIILSGPRIIAGESLSAPIDCTMGQVMRFTMPKEWTPAPLTFQLSTDGGYFHNVHDSRGDELKCTVTPDAALILDDKWRNAIAYLKFRSGTSDTPIPQIADREFSIVVMSTVVENPVPVSALLEGTTTVKITFDKALDQSIMPVLTAFSVMHSGPASVVSNAIFFNATTVQLTMNKPLSGIIKLTYLTPTSNWLRSVSNFAVESFSDYPVMLAPVAAVLTSLNPSSAVVGSPYFTIQVIGTGFTPQSVIVWNGGDENTTYVNPTLLTTGVNPETASGAFTVPIKVRTIDLVSNELQFSFTESTRRR